MSIDRALEIYGREHAPHVAAPRIIGFAIYALSPFWGALPVSAIKGETCRAYVRHRAKAPATAAREPSVLSAAVNYCMKEGYLTSTPRVTLPAAPVTKERWLTRHEAAKLLWAARRMRHLRTFILIGLYTGTRSAAILGLRWMPNTTGGWVDLEAGLLFRGAQGALGDKQAGADLPATGKTGRASATSCRRHSVDHVIEWDGEPVSEAQRAPGALILRPQASATT